MGNDQPDEADQAGEGDGDSDCGARGEKGEEARASHVDAERRRALVAQGEQVQAAGEGEQDEHRGEQCEAGTREERHRLVAEGACQPEGDRLHLVGAQHRLDRKYQGGGERVEDDAGEQGPRRVEGPPGPAQREHEEGRRHGAGDGGQLRGEHAGERRRGGGCRPDRTAGSDGDDGDPDGGAAREAEDERVGERIAQERLQRDAGDREGRPDFRGEQDARNAEAEEHGGVRLPAVQGVPQRQRSRAGGEPHHGG